MTKVIKKVVTVMHGDHDDRYDQGDGHDDVGHDDREDGDDHEERT